MGRIINGGKAIKLYQPHYSIDNSKHYKERYARGLHVMGPDYACVNGKRRRLHLSSTSKWKMGQIGEDLAMVREHLGLTMSEALTVALHLTAQAIRQNRAKVQLP